MMCVLLIWLEVKILSAFLILPHGIKIGVNLSNSPAKSSLKFMNFWNPLLHIGYLYPYLRYPCLWDLVTYFVVMVLGLWLWWWWRWWWRWWGCWWWWFMLSLSCHGFCVVFESLLFPVFVLALACICKEVNPLNPVSSIKSKTGISLENTLKCLLNAL